MVYHSYKDMNHVSDATGWIAEVFREQNLNKQQLGQQQLRVDSVKITAYKQL